MNFDRDCTAGPDSKHWCAMWQGRFASHLPWPHVRFLFLPFPCWCAEGKAPPRL